MSPEPLDEGWLDSVASALRAVHAPDAPDGAVQFTVSGAPSGARTFHAVVASGGVSVSPGRHPSPDVVLGWTYTDLVAVLRGDLSLEVAYMSGSMKLEGDQVLLFDGWRSLCQSPQFREALASVG